MIRDKPAAVFIVIGGTGVIGVALQGVLRAKGLHVLSVSMDPDLREAGFDNLGLDVTTTSAADLIARLEQAVGSDRQVVAALDILGLAPDMASALARLAQSRQFPVGVVSSCMVYAKQGVGPFDETTPTLAPEVAPHLYQRTKLAREAFWQNGIFRDWLIFRTNHVLGRNALLGSIPDHNRDPRLIEHLRQNRPLGLARGGEVWLSYVHPADFAAAAAHLLLETGVRATAVNLVHPTPVRAVDYYVTICRMMGLPPPQITAVQTDPNDFWSLTAEDNVFASAHAAVRSFAFTRDIEACIHDALDIGPEAYPRLGDFMRARIAGKGPR